MSLGISIVLAAFIAIPLALAVSDLIDWYTQDPPNDEDFY